MATTTLCFFSLLAIKRGEPHRARSPVRRSFPVRTTIVAALGLLVSMAQAQAADWPQWRGPDRSNVSLETGLLNKWPQHGPPLAWKGSGLGDGVCPVAVAGGRVFSTGYQGDAEYCTAVSAKDGKRLWTVKVGPAVRESSIMRWLSQRTPTVDADRLYVVTVGGEWICLSTLTGKELWRKHYQKDFEGKRSIWGFCDYPLVDGDNLIITPGGEKATVAALNKHTGETVWTCSLPGGDSSSHAVLVPMEIGGVRQYVNQLSKWMMGVSAKDGKLLWKYDGMRTGTAATYAPVVRGNTVFYASGYGAGHVLLKITRKGNDWGVEEVYRKRSGPYLPWLGSPTQVDSHIFLNSLSGLHCIKRETAQPVWEVRLGRCMYTVADGRLYIRLQKGTMCLAAADSKGYRLIGEFTPPQADSKQPAWTFPVVANGHLFVRDFDTLLCYDVRDVGPRKKNSDAVYVPTPMDVVKKMLEVAAVKKSDVVYDLGSGDGRIVIAAVKAYGCRAVGVEIDEDLVKVAWAQAKEAEVEKQVSLQHADLFEIDFADADVVTLYLLPEMNKRLIPKLERLRPGARVVAHYFPIPGMKPVKVVKMTSEEDDLERNLYLYTIPLKKQ
jgi:outer membrane protein assembly factor BamB/protein-L-isoaspartate O-methyltransferase